MVTEREKLIDMLKLQDDLNKKININWREIRKKEDFIRATWVECAELVDSLPWKWWKKQTADINNVKVEIVDIWHFIMSYLLMEFNTYNDIVNSEYIEYMFKGIDRDFRHLEDINIAYIHHYLGEKEKINRIIYSAERVAEGFLKENIKEGMFFFGLLINEVFKFDELYLLYVGKNILNHIRQEFGYKDGKYRKQIEGFEDNKYMFDIVQSVETKEELEEKLRQKFNELFS
jgi:hypothetical protein